MLPSQVLRKEIDRVKASCQRRGTNVDFSQYEELEAQRKKCQVETEALQAQSNQLSSQVAIAKREGSSAESILADLAGISKKKKQCEVQLRNLLESFILIYIHMMRELSRSSKK